MTNYPVKQLLSGETPVGTTVQAAGWVRSKRDSKAGISFLSIYDGSCFDSVQAVVPETLANYQNEVLNLTTGCSVLVTGVLVESGGKGQAYEIQAEAVNIVGWVDDPESYPVAKKRHTFEFLREVAHLRPRTNAFGAISRVRTTLANAIHNYFYEQGFHWVNTPVVTASDCEGAGELFQVSTLDTENLPRTDSGNIDYEQDFFGKQAFLTVSGQLTAEAYALALSKVYTFGPTFRAENSNTTRHLAEFWMVEPEVAFADLQQNALLAEHFLKTICGAVLEDCGDDMAFFAQRIDKQAVTRLEKLVNSEFVHMEYGEAISVLEKCGQSFEFPVKWGVDLQSEHEQYLAEKHVNGPLILKNYPKEIKAFYMRQNDDGQTVAAMDVLAPGIGEIIGGSQREERLDVLDAQMARAGIAGGMEWYRDLRRYGTVPHSGFGMGFERLINYVTGMENIRDAIPFPRTPKHAPF